MFLDRTTEKEAIRQLLKVMASTPHGSWAACPSFGIRDFLEDARIRPELMQKAVLEANKALSELGVTSFRLGRVVRNAGAALGVEDFDLEPAM